MQDLIKEIRQMVAWEVAEGHHTSWVGYCQFLLAELEEVTEERNVLARRLIEVQYPEVAKELDDWDNCAAPFFAIDKS
jgi:hypothetical protein